MRRSRELFERANKVIPGGVNSPVRAFRAVGGQPVFLARGKGSRVWSADGDEYIDYVGSWGPLILGHAYPEVIEAVVRAAADGATFGAPTEREVELAEALCRALPSMAKVRFVSSGTEATMAALRVARGFTGREKIIKIDGGYHGHADCLLVEAGSGAATLGIPGSAGVTRGAAQDTLIVPWNDLPAIERTIEQHEVAAVIVEPVCGNMGCIPPRAGYLEGLRALTAKRKIILIFDEVMTGFRVAWGGAQLRYGVTPDLTCLGKIVGGGLPLAAYGGRAEIMARVAPEGPVYQAGTLSGNPLAVAAGLKTLKILSHPGTYEKLEATSARLIDGIGQLAREANVPLRSERVGSMFTGFFTDGEVWDYASAKRADTGRFGKWFTGMLVRKIYLAPSQFEADFVSLAHSDEDIALTLEAARATLKTL